jgi:hypothetical protein
LPTAKLKYTFLKVSSNSKQNLQSRKKAEAKTKDKWENYLTSEVKAGKMSLVLAQRDNLNQ